MSHDVKNLQKQISKLYNERDSLISSIRKMKNISEYEINEDECVICFHISDQIVSNKHLPCCSKNICTDCLEQIDICPFCRYDLIF